MTPRFKIKADNVHGTVQVWRPRSCPRADVHESPPATLVRFESIDSFLNEWHDRSRAKLEDRDCDHGNSSFDIGAVGQGNCSFDLDESQGDCGVDLNTSFSRLSAADDGSASFDPGKWHARLFV